MGYPQIASQFLNGFTREELEEIWQAVCEELTATKFRNRTHHNMKTYQFGCHGPLCTKSIRDYTARRQSTGTSQRYQQLNPVLLIFMNEATKQIEAYDSQLLEKLIS